MAAIPVATPYVALLRSCELVDSSTGVGLAVILKSTLRQVQLFITPHLGVLHGFLMEVLGFTHETRQVFHMVVSIFVLSEAHNQDVLVVADGFLEFNQVRLVLSGAKLWTLVIPRLQAH